MESVSALVFFVTVFSVAEGQSAVPAVEYGVWEEQPRNTFVGNVVESADLVKIYDASVLPELRYSFLSPAQQYFTIEETTGIIRTKEKIDRDRICPGLEDCRQSADVAIGPHNHFRVVPVTIDIQDMNDNSPFFSQTEITTFISESAPIGETIPLPIPEDPDSPANGLRSYRLRPQRALFEVRDSLSPDGGVDLQLVLKEKLDREHTDSYKLRVIAYDAGDPARSGSVNVNIVVEDANDNLPVFTNDTYTVTVPENLLPNATIVTVSAHDADLSQNAEISYGFSSRTLTNFDRQFGISPTTGTIYIRRRLDAETETTYHLVVLARDNGAQAKVSHATVVVNVQDMNDNRPEITVNTLIPGKTSAEISERQDLGTFVAHVSVLDKDNGPNGRVSCYVNDSNFDIQKLHSTQYKIVTNNMFDREETARYVVMVTCEDEGSPVLRSTYNLTVKVKDVNDQPPVFNQSEYSAKIQENNVADAFVLRVRATDRDLGNNSEVRYSLTPESAGFFRIIPETGVIRVAKNLDYEEVQMLRFRVIATDQGTPQMSATASVTVYIQDRNDNPPVFIQRDYTFAIFENMDANAEVGAVSAYDPDSAEFSEIEYALYAEESYVLDAIDIDPTTGEIFTKMPLDRESIQVYELQVLAYNPGYDLTSTATITIYVADVNDNVPEFEFPNLTNDTVQVSSAVPYGYVVTRVRASDADIGDNAQLVYALVRGNEDGLFDIDGATGAVTTTTSLASYADSVYNLSVEVIDSGEESMTAIHTFHVVINSSILYEHQEFLAPSGGDRSTANSLIVIAVGCASGAIIVALIVAILAIRLQDGRRKKDRRYNCRMEAQKMLNLSPTHTDGRSTPSDKEINIYNPSPKYPPPALGSGPDLGPAPGDNNIQMGPAAPPDGGTMSSRTSSFNDTGSLSRQFLLDRTRATGGNGQQVKPWTGSLDRSQSPRHSPATAAPCPSHGQCRPPPPPSHPTLHTFTLPQTEVGHHHGYRADAHQPHGFPAHTAAVHKQLPPVTEDVQLQPVTWAGRGGGHGPAGDHDNESACSGEMSNTDSGRGASEEGEGGHHGNSAHHPGQPGSRRLSDTSDSDLQIPGDRPQQPRLGCHGDRVTMDSEVTCPRHGNRSRAPQPWQTPTVTALGGRDPDDSMDSAYVGSPGARLPPRGVLHKQPPPRPPRVTMVTSPVDESLYASSVADDDGASSTSGSYTVDDLDLHDDQHTVTMATAQDSSV